MEVLRETLSQAGFDDVRTHAQDGNVRVTTRMRKPTKVAQAIEAALAARLGFEVDALVRTLDELAATHRYGASLESPIEGEVQRHVAFLRQAPPPDIACVVAAWDVPGEAVVLHDRELHLWSRLPLRSAVIPAQLRSAPLEAATGALTIRSWKVVDAIAGRWVNDEPSGK